MSAATYVPRCERCGQVGAVRCAWRGSADGFSPMPVGTLCAACTQHQPGEPLADGLLIDAAPALLAACRAALAFIDELNRDALGHYDRAEAERVGALLFSAVTSVDPSSQPPGDEP